jgi:hypothetical protein
MPETTEAPGTAFTWTRRHVASGFAVSAGLMVAAAAAALTLLREDGRGQAVNLVELRAAGA